MALTVLNVPMVSISMTDLNPLGDRPEMGATKLPAAPALHAGDGQYAVAYGLSSLIGRDTHDEVNSTKLLDTTIGRSLQTVELWTSVSVCVRMYTNTLHANDLRFSHQHHRYQ